MEPRPDNRGKTRGIGPIRRLDAVLQWSRGLITAENAQSVVTALQNVLELSMERRLDNRGKRPFR